MSEINMNEEVVMVVEDATVITTPIDDTLTISGDAADAKAVGDALALKADLSQVTGITVNGQQADAQGAILIDGDEIPVSGEDATTMAEKFAEIDARTGEDIPIDSEESAEPIADVIGGIQDALAVDSVDDSGFVMGTNITKDTARVFRIGNLVIVAITATLADGASVSTGTTLCTIPEEYWPAAQVFAVAGSFDRNGNITTNRFGHFYINTSGQIRQNLTSNWTSGGFGMTFIYHV